MSEWSKEPDLRSGSVSCVGSNPTLSIFDLNKSLKGLYRDGAEAACWAHNPKVEGSKPSLDILFPRSLTVRMWPFQG